MEQKGRRPAGGEPKKPPTLELEISGDADWKDCKVESIIGYSGRPPRFELELLERKQGSNIGRSIPSHKVTLTYQAGVATAEHIDLSACEKTSTFEIRVDVGGEICTSKPAQVKIVAPASPPPAPAIAHAPATPPASAAPSKTSRLKLGAEGDVITGPKFVAVIPIETFGEDGKQNSATVTVRIAKGKGVVFTDKAAGTPVAGSGSANCQLTTMQDKPFLLAVEFKGQLDVGVEISYPDAKETRGLVLQYPL